MKGETKYTGQLLGWHRFDLMCRQNGRQVFYGQYLVASSWDACILARKPSLLI